MYLFLLMLLLSYLAGSIPSSIITGKVLRGIDIREHGSGNAGGTNVFRVLGWKAGVFVSLFDVFKGFAATFWISGIAFGFAGFPEETMRLAAGFAAIAGHIWTVFAGFRGGKGVGTAAGMLLALYPLSLLICFIVFILTFLLTRIVSVSSMAGAVTLPIVLSVFRFGLLNEVPDSLYYFSFFAAALIIFTHRSNIRRLIDGTENKFSRKNSA
ncbi:MAG: glycerol-3-phosphate 1-O-acyltransferase PlsY [Calditrichaceae bacterium]